MSDGGLTEDHAELILARPLAEREELIGTAADKQMSPAELERYITARIAEEKKRRSYLRRAAVLSDRRLFFNTVNKAVKVLKLAGVAVTTEKKQCGGCTELTIRFPEK
jgi:ParB family chromosome partitioning protein